jgi:predicted GTPase
MDAPPCQEFERSPRKEPLFLKGSYGRAVEALLQGLREHEILVLLTGAPGVGKSVALRAVLAGNCSPHPDQMLLGSFG